MIGHVRSNLVAYLALFLALGGSGYAARGLVLPVNSVGSAQVVDHSLRRQDFRQAALLRGPQGQTGPRGEQGPAGSIDNVPAGGDLQGSLPDPEIRPGAVNGEKIAPGAVSAYQTRQSVPWISISDPRVVNGKGYLGSWHDAGDDWRQPAYYLDFFGDLHLRGSIAGGTVSNSESGAAFWFCAGDDVLGGEAGFSVPTETAGGAFVPGEVEIVQLQVPPGGNTCGFATVPTHNAVYEVRVVAGSNARVSLDGVSVWLDANALTD